MKEPPWILTLKNLETNSKMGDEWYLTNFQFVWCLNGQLRLSELIVVTVDYCSHLQIEYLIALEIHIIVSFFHGCFLNRNTNFKPYSLVYAILMLVIYITIYSEQVDANT
jgi:hypothetical protein